MVALFLLYVDFRFLDEGAIEYSLQKATLVETRNIQIMEKDLLRR